VEKVRIELTAYALPRRWHLIGEWSSRASLANLELSFLPEVPGPQGG